jgi:hypothetical protein
MSTTHEPGLKTVVISTRRVGEQPPPPRHRRPRSVERMILAAFVAIWLTVAVLGAVFVDRVTA